MLNIIKYYKLWLWASIALTVVAIIALAFFGLKPGIDFTGGTLTQVRFNGDLPSTGDVQIVVAEAGTNNAIIQSAGERSMIIRTEPLEKEQHDKIVEGLKTKYGDITEEQFTSIGPVIGQELRRSAVWQLVLVSLGIVLYIAYAFRKVSRPVSSWRFGIAAIIALIHDLFIVVGIFAILGRFMNVEVDGLFITALLTVLGFSVHDTIVVFDRIRENLKTRFGSPLSEIINSSINQTIVRSLNTTLTVVFVLSALLLFGGETIRYFVLALLIGIVAGTYSSIFIAAPILLVWQDWDNRKNS